MNITEFINESWKKMLGTKEEFEQVRKEKWRCPECDEIREGDARVEAGMKCGFCAYLIH